MKPAIIYTLLGIQSFIFVGFLWVIDMNAGSRSDIQRAETVLITSGISLDIKDLSYRLSNIEDEIEDGNNVWTLQDVEDLIKSFNDDMKTFIKTQDKKIVKEQKKKYEIFYIEDNEGKLYRIFAIEPEKGNYIIMKMESVTSFPE